MPRDKGLEQAGTFRAMISCKNVAKLLSSDALSDLTLWRRAEVRLHLAMCKYCSRFARQIKQLRNAVRLTSGSAEADSNLEERIILRIRGDSGRERDQ